jgi:hypothetical protein
MQNAQGGSINSCPSHATPNRSGEQSGSAAESGEERHGVSVTELAAGG